MIELSTSFQSRLIEDNSLTNSFKNLEKQPILPLFLI